MTNEELNQRAGLSAFMDDDGQLTEAIDGFAPLTDSDDCLRLLVATGISFRRFDEEVIAESMSFQHSEPVLNGDVLAAARRSATALAASLIPNDDVARATLPALRAVE